MKAVMVRPEQTFGTTERVCPRCGVHWVDNHAMWKLVAPCFDCRPVLRKEGVDIQSYKREKAS